MSLNANGVRSALRKGLSEVLRRENPDVLLLQEVRCDHPPGDLEAVLDELGHTLHWQPGARRGYAGVAISTRLPVQAVWTPRVCPHTDAEGRVLSVRAGGVTWSSVYLPSGSSRPERQALKDALLPAFLDWARGQTGAHLIGGDLNVAHGELDIKNWRSNQNNSGFLPHERAFLGELLRGYRDLHREHLGERREYTWWSNRGNAFENDTGWRIDYLLARGLAPGGPVRVLRGARLSDHAALLTEVVVH